MRYPICQSLTGKLTWTHYCELLSVSDDDKRKFYEKECENAEWSVRELKRQMASSLFERLLLSKCDANKETVLELASKGIEYAKPEDAIKDPYVFEFLGIPEEKPILESDLEAALVRQIENFLLELGRGFIQINLQVKTVLQLIIQSIGQSAVQALKKTKEPTAAPSTEPTKKPASTKKPSTKKKKMSVKKVAAKKNTKKITGTLSVTGAKVMVKVGNAKAKKAIVKGKTFTFKLSKKLKKNTKVVITITKSKYYTVKKTIKTK